MRKKLADNSQRFVFAVLCFVVLCTPISYLVLRNCYIDMDTGRTYGVVVRFFVVKYITCSYQYKVNGKYYHSETANGVTSYLRKCQHLNKKEIPSLTDTNCLNKIFVVEYSTRNPSISRILLDQPLPDTLRTLP